MGHPVIPSTYDNVGSTQRQEVSFQSFKNGTRRKANQGFLCLLCWAVQLPSACNVIGMSCVSIDKNHKAACDPEQNAACLKSTYYY
jgi:hypothetical protein